MDEVMKDKRFAHISKDPRFRTMPQQQRKVKIDKRFKSMFSDKRFKMKYTVDKRGRPVNHTTNENLKKFYELSDTGTESDSNNDNDSSDEESALIAKLGAKVSKQSKPTTSKNKNESEENKLVHDRSKSKTIADKSKSVKEIDSEMVISKSLKKKESKVSRKVENGKSKVVSSESDDSDADAEETSDEDDKSDDSDSAPKVGDGEPDYARGEGMIESSTDEDDDEEEDGNDNSLDHNWGELDKNVPETQEIGLRLAVCNMDWDRVKAEDIFVLLNSFKPAGGMILSVRIYPSEFGIERMKEEALHGPTELKEFTTEVEVDEQEDENEDDEENPYHREKLRQYQLNRLKYYYAVAEFDSKKTTNAVYEECDGMEYQTSAAKIDLRFIPDNMTFDQSVKSECTSQPETSTYKPPTFLTTALCQTKVNLTWDETDQDRVKVTMRKFDKKGDVNEDDFKAYLASSSENEEPDCDNLIDQSDASPDEDEQIEKYRNLLKDIDDSGNKDEMNMEIEWEPGLKDTTKDILDNKEKSKDMTPWKQYQEKKKEKKKQKREERKQKRLADKAAGPNPTFSDDELPKDLDLTDSFFTDELKEKPKTPKKKKGKKKKEEEKDEETEKKEAELSLLLMDEKDDGRQHFSLRDLVEKEKKKKKKKDKKQDVKLQDDFEMDLKDSRFDAVFSSHLFNIDPSAPEFKKTKGMETLIQEKLKRRAKESQSGNQKKSKLDKMERHESDSRDMPKEQSLSSLLKSVKAKTQQYHSKKTKKKTSRL